MMRGEIKCTIEVIGKVIILSRVNTKYVSRLAPANRNAVIFYEFYDKQGPVKIDRPLFVQFSTFF